MLIKFSSLKKRKDKLSSHHCDAFCYSSFSVYPSCFILHLSVSVRSSHIVYNTFTPENSSHLWLHLTLSVFLVSEIFWVLGVKRCVQITCISIMCHRFVSVYSQRGCMTYEQIIFIHVVIPSENIVLVYVYSTYSSYAQLW